jgi:hypothetical protein
MDAVLRRLGGTARRWRVDRMASVCEPASGRLLASFGAVARYYGVSVDVCARYRANRKGAVESRNHFLAQRFWRTLVAKTPQEAQAKLDRFSERAGDARRRGSSTVAQVAAAERLLPLPAFPYPATLEVERTVSAACLVSYEGNRYSVPPGLHGQRVSVRRRLGSEQIELVSAAGLRTLAELVAIFNLTQFRMTFRSAHRRVGGPGPRDRFAPAWSPSRAARRGSRGRAGAEPMAGRRCRHRRMDDRRLETRPAEHLA